MGGRGKKRNWKTAAAVWLTVLLAVYFGVFCYLNMVKITEHADSDTAAEALLARAVWEEKSLTPDNWISSTERRIISPAALGALFYGAGLDMNLSMGLACTVFGAAIIGGFAWLLRSVRLSFLGVAAACLALCCLPVNGVPQQGGMLPFFTYLVFLFAGYYAPHIIAMLFGLAAYFRLRRGEKSVFVFLSGGGAALLTLTLGASGMRCFQVVTAPLLILEILDCYKITGRFTRRLPFERRWAAGYAALLLFCNVAGMCYPSSVNQQLYVLTSGQAAGRLFGEVPAAVLGCMGIDGGTALKSFGGLMQMCVYAWIAVTVFACFFVGRRREEGAEETRRLLVFFLCSLLFTVFVTTVSSVAVYDYYFFIVIFLAAAAVGSLADALADKYRVLWTAGIAFLSFYALANLAYTYLPAAASDGRQQAVREVAEFMEEEGLDYGYAQFWNANRLTAVSEGGVTMGGVYDMSNLEMYWWLTDKRWYVPDLPEEMPTAYVVTADEEKGFLEGVGDSARMEKAFSNGSYIVYVSDRNLVSR